MNARWSLAVCLFALPGCAREVRDTEQRIYAVECKAKACKLVLPATQETFEPRATGRVVVACPTGESQPIECRPLVCDSSSICERLGGEKAACIEGLCQISSRSLGAEDRLALCLAGTGPWSGTPTQRSRAALAMSCRPPCELPAACGSPEQEQQLD